jgi:quercetin dioxygenase-like cupin family protein
VVVHAEGRIWLSTIAPKGAGPRGGTRVARVGPLPLPRVRAYTIEVAEAVLPPGSRSGVHTHAGPEAWYMIAGEQCLDTPAGVRRASAGQTRMVPGYTPMQLVVTGSVLRRSLVLVVHDAATPFSSPSTWTPSGRCTGESEPRR